jgi:hypothetical protein
MDFYPNYYGLIFITNISESQSIKILEAINGNKSKNLINCLREAENYIGWHDSCLVISSPNVMDFLSDPKTDFAQNTIWNFPGKTIFATYYYSVTGSQGICKIVNESTEICFFNKELNEDIENKHSDLEDNFMQNQFGQKLSTILGRKVEMKQFNSFNSGKCL